MLLLPNPTILIFVIIPCVVTYTINECTIQVPKKHSMNGSIVQQWLWAAIGSWFQNSFYHVGLHIFLNNRWVKVITLSYHAEMYGDQHNGWDNHRSWDDTLYNAVHILLPSYLMTTNCYFFLTTFQITHTFWCHVLETTHRVCTNFNL